MNAERLLAHYEHIADAPDAIARLRRFILDLAVRGKLVPQDPKDEPASELLKRIAVTKAREAEVKGARPSMDRPDWPFSPPAGWAFARLATTSRRIHYGYTASADVGIRNVRLLRITDIQNNAVDWSSVPGCRIDPGTVEQYKLEKGDILIARTGGTIGKSFLVRSIPVVAVFASYLIRIQSTNQVFDEYVRLFLESSLYWSQLQEGARGTGQPNVNGQTLGNLALSLPPLAEQHRIVAKVDELMALCDRLAAARAEREATRDRLAAVSLARLNTPDPDTFHDDARFALDALRALTTRPDQIKQLRQTILNLAVRGKLVPQDPRDEPASELLKRIAAEKKRLGIVAAKRTLDSDDRLPIRWASVTLADYAIDVFTGPFGSALHQSDYVVGGIPLVNPSHMIDDEIIPDEKVSVTAETAQRLASYRLSSGDIVMARRGEVGRAALVSEHQEGWLCGTGSFFLGFAAEVNRQFLLLVLRSGDLRSYLAGQAVGTTMVNLNHGILKAAPLAVPPLAEQHRIVAKVDELMALCDRLEASLATGEASRRRLLDALLAEALAPAADAIATEAA